jgi:subfamily B ATP-binding cassette protein HlyB/CyaB
MDMKKKEVTGEAFLWALQGICAIHRKPFSAELATQQFAAPYTADAWVTAAQAYGFEASLRKVKIEKFQKEEFPLIAWLSPKLPVPSPTNAAPEDADHSASENESDQKRTVPALVLQADANHVLVIEPGSASPITVPRSDLNLRYLGYLTRIVPKAEPGTDPDSEAQARQARKFGFSWFIPELLKHKKLWQEILLASLIIQLIALATPLFTQTIIDKVVVHHAQSTLIVIAIGMTLFMLFSAGLSWLRQYLVLHTGNPPLSPDYSPHLAPLPTASMVAVTRKFSAIRISSTSSLG